MTTPIRIWTRAIRHPAFECGGWAFVRSGPELYGQAGGARRTTVQRMVLSGLTASLKDLAPGAVDFDLGDRQIAQITAKIVAGGELAEAERPEEDLDLWAHLTTALKGRKVTFRLGAHTTGGPAAFTQAWADLAMDKAKVSGPFAASIPKPNLAQVKF